MKAFFWGKRTVNLFKFTYFPLSLFAGMVAMLAARKQFAWQGWVLFRGCILLEDPKPAKVFHKVMWQATGLGFPHSTFFFSSNIGDHFFLFYFHCATSLKTDSNLPLMLLLFRNIHKKLAEIICRWWGTHNRFGCDYWSVSQWCDCLSSS